MESKKAPGLNLEKQKVYRFQIGIVLGLSLALVAFEWSHIEYKPTIDYKVDVGEETEIMENYKIIKEPIPELPKPVKEKSQEIKVVEELVKKEEPVEIIEEKDPVPDVVLVNIPIEAPEPDPEPEIFTIVEKMPEFKGGEAEMYKFLGKNMKYPYLAKDAGIQGIVHVTFLILEDGSIDSVRILRGIGAGCDEEAIRAIKKMPKWNPGMQRGRNVRVQFNMPVYFVLKQG